MGPSLAASSYKGTPSLLELISLLPAAFSDSKLSGLTSRLRGPT